MERATASTPRHVRRSGQGFLAGGRDIRRVLETGSRRSGRRMIVYVRPGEQGTRAAFVCGRRVGGAVDRNRGRRLLREAWRALAPEAREGYDVVFVARSSIVASKIQDLVPEMTQMLVATGVIPA